MSPVEFFFDFASPYGFIAAKQIDRIKRPVVWRPFLLGAVYKRFGRSPLEHPLKRDHVINVDAPRRTRRIGLALKVPEGFPPTESARRAKRWLSYWRADREQIFCPT